MPNQVQKQNPLELYYQAKKLHEESFPELKKISEIEQAYRKAIQLNPDLFAPHYYLGKLLYQLKRYSEAEKEFREVIRLQPDFTWARIYLVRCLSAYGVPTQLAEIASMHIQDVLDLFENNLRKFIEAKLIEGYGENWCKRGLPFNILKNCQDRKAKSEKDGEEDMPLLTYADFTYLRQIIVKRDNWKNIFQACFKSAESVVGKLTELEGLRNIAAHHRRQLTRDEVLRIKLYYCDFMKVLRV